MRWLDAHPSSLKDRRNEILPTLQTVEGNATGMVPQVADQVRGPRTRAPSAAQFDPMSRAAPIARIARSGRRTLISRPDQGTEGAARAEGRKLWETAGANGAARTDRKGSTSQNSICRRARADNAKCARGARGRESLSLTRPSAVRSDGVEARQIHRDRPGFSGRNQLRHSRPTTPERHQRQSTREPASGVISKAPVSGAASPHTSVHEYSRTCPLIRA